MSRKERKSRKNLDVSKKPWIDDILFSLMDKHHLTYEEAWDEMIAHMLTYTKHRDPMRRYAKKLHLKERISAMTQPVPVESQL